MLVGIVWEDLRTARTAFLRTSQALSTGTGEARAIYGLEKEVEVKRLLLLIALLSISSSAVVGQAGHAGQEKNLRGLKGVRLVVMFARADAIDEAERPGILELVEADAIAKFEEARIPLFRFANEVEEAGFPQLMVYITADIPNGFVQPVVTKVSLLQRVRIARDPSIEADLATWEAWGIGSPKLTVEMIRSLVAGHIDQFIKDYIAVNSKLRSSRTPLPEKALQPAPR